MKYLVATLVTLCTMTFGANASSTTEKLAQAEVKCNRNHVVCTQIADTCVMDFTRMQKHGVEGNIVKNCGYCQELCEETSKFCEKTALLFDDAIDSRRWASTCKHVLIVRDDMIKAKKVPTPKRSTKERIEAGVKKGEWHYLSKK